MERVDPPADFAHWRRQARELLRRNIPPQEILWAIPEQDELFSSGSATHSPSANEQSPIQRATQVSAEFLKLARAVACHQDSRRWALLYELLWRLTHGSPRLLQIASDAQVAQANTLAKAVRREIHKAHAFVRFRKVGERPDPTADNPAHLREQFVAWFEPDHHIVEAAAPFFVRRFPNQDWSILTPKGCAHWNGRQLSFSPGIATNPGHEDALEEHWRTYYRSIFNPARLKLRMMKSEMPQRYWKNLPETTLIEPLSRSSATRTEAMVATEPRLARPAGSLPYLKQLAALDQVDEADQLVQTLRQTSTSADFRHLLGRSLNACRACPLWQNATCAVVGIGPLDGRLMLIGEQPGDQEDLANEPFIGPAGQLLKRALAEAGIDSASAYLTNAVKHFKWTPGPRRTRLHRSPSASEIDACRPWLELELRQLKPRLLVLLGASAVRSLLGPGYKLQDLRGWLHAPQLAPTVFVTHHPSALLRQRSQTDSRAIPSSASAHQALTFHDYVADFRQIAAALSQPNAQQPSHQTQTVEDSTQL